LLGENPASGVTPFFANGNVSTHGENGVTEYGKNKPPFCQLCQAIMKAGIARKEALANPCQRASICIASAVLVLPAGK
jgi:hypothetical protein